ncbi:hypothetical protein MTP99_010328 [Tenebrio molitor]|jgi:hypothetical protein|nr:hypothetical protein MTP99_010328 [Tenebrio molitor]
MGVGQRALRNFETLDLEVCIVDKSGGEKTFYILAVINQMAKKSFTLYTLRTTYVDSKIGNDRRTDQAGQCRRDLRKFEENTTFFASGNRRRPRNYSANFNGSADSFLNPHQPTRRSINNMTGLLTVEDFFLFSINMTNLSLTRS